ncbi:MAG: hypothetical protein ACI8RN_002583 [Glaciecola sp.]|jgi:hypothetical protein|uniref:putative signal transducing protein n=1 Tax=Congregibacter sp. TaxID=2744308 RepID=UPI0039E3AEDB
MKLAYTHPNGIVVAQARSVLELAGIESVLRNEFASGAIGELAPIDAWPEVWVVRDRDCETAIRLLEEAQKTVNEADWECALCGSASPATFEYCWHCGGDRAKTISG